MQSIELSGSSREMGEQFGEAFREEIAELYELRVANAIRDAYRFGGRVVTEQDLLELSAVCYEISDAFDSEGASEQVGIARGSHLSIAQITALGGLTDLRDVLSWAGPLERDGGCTGIIRYRERIELAQTWDLASDNMPYVVYVNRKPSQGPETWSVTTVGCLSLIGMNEYGTALGTTNLRTTDARPGVPYLNVIHRSLRESTAHAASEVVKRAPRAAAHSFLIADSSTGMVVECSATEYDVRYVYHATPALVQTNHCLTPAHQEIESTAPNDSSHARFARASELVQEADLRDILADVQNEELAICRHDFEGISTNAAVIMCPSKATMSIVHGPPDENLWADMEIVCRVKH
jgi:isopenicillin-N N-acyltransferase-like protein